MQYIKAVFDTPGVGGAVAGAVVLLLIVCYGLTLRWISMGSHHEDKAEKH